MSAAHPASQVQRNATAAPARSAPSRQPARTAQSFGFNATKEEPQLRIHLGDIARFDEGMDVEGFKPTLLSRLLDLILPLGKR